MQKFKSPYINLPKNFKNLEPEILAAIKKVFSSGSFILKEEVKKFEENIISHLKTNFAIGVNSGTDALFLSLYALNLQPDDEVITVAHTFVATVASIVHAGCRPILIDISDDFNIDVEKIESALSKRTKAIIPVHMNGRVCNMDRICKIAEKHKLFVIEDAAQAFGAEFRGKKAGSFGMAGCFSMHPMKILGAGGDAGIITTNNNSFSDKIKSLRNHGQKTKDNIFCYGFSSRLDNLQAAILNIKLKYIDLWIEKRRQIATLYHEELSKLSSITLPHRPEQSRGDYFDIFSSYVIRVKEQESLYNYLRNNGVECFIHWKKPLHHHQNLNLSKFFLPKTDAYSKEIVSLPIFAEMTEAQVEHVVKLIKSFYQKGDIN